MAETAFGNIVSPRHVANRAIRMEISASGVWSDHIEPHVPEMRRTFSDSDRKFRQGSTVTRTMVYFHVV
ncbi:hypothetical protein RDE2_24230 [Rhodococcus sp. RDE2]|nr:hypothetical protein RDE2_24230 [Rhodococcus sp. RDE2]